MPRAVACCGWGTGATRRGAERRRKSAPAPRDARRGVGGDIGLAGVAARRRRRRSAQRLLQISGATRTATVLVPVGKTEDVRIDAPFTDITVGDPEVADVAPLTDRALSILGKKIGTTRVTVYAEGKRQVGIFDIEVSYDVSRLADRDRPGRRPRHQGVVGQRPHHAVGHGAGRGHARQGGDHRAPVRARDHQHGRGGVAAAGHAGGALRRGLAPGRPRARRAVERVQQPRGRQHRLAAAGRQPADHGADQIRPTSRSAKSPRACSPARRRSASCSAA